MDFSKNESGGSYLSRQRDDYIGSVQMYKVYIKNIFFSKIFWIAISITLLTFFAGSYQSLIVKDNALACFECATVWGPGHIVAMVLSPLPFLVIFSEETQRRAAYYQIVRTSKRKYIFDQIMAVFTSVMGMGFIVLLVFLLICKAYDCDFSLAEQAQKLYGLGIFENIVKNNTILFYLLVYISYVLYILPGAFFTMIISCFVKNKYIVFAMPWIVFRFFQILALVSGNSYLDWSYASFVGTTMSESLEGMLYCYLYPSALCLFAIIFYYIIFKRRFVNGKS